MSDNERTNPHVLSARLHKSRLTELKKKLNQIANSVEEEKEHRIKLALLKIQQLDEKITNLTLHEEPLSAIFKHKV